MLFCRNALPSGGAPDPHPASTLATRSEGGTPELTEGSEGGAGFGQLPVPGSHDFSSSLERATCVHLQNYRHSKSFAQFKGLANQILILSEESCCHSIDALFVFLH